MSGGAPDTFTTLIASLSYGRSSVFTMCFPDKIVDYEGVDVVMSYDDYVEELLHIVISQPEPDYVLSDFYVLALRDDEDASPAPATNMIMDDFIVDISSLNILGHVVGE